MNDFIDICISTGKVIYLENNIKLSKEDELKVEDILHRYNDTTARYKIKKLIKGYYNV